MNCKNKSIIKITFLLCLGMILAEGIPTASKTIFADSSENTTASFTVVAGTSSNGNGTNSTNSTNRLGTTTQSTNNSNNANSSSLSDSSASSGNKNSTLILQNVPNLNFKTVSAAAVYNGDDITLSQSSQSTTTDTSASRTLSVADYRGYSKNYRGWVVSATVTPFSNGKSTISPSITLHFSQNLTTSKISPVTLTSKNASVVVTSKTDPTQGAGISNIVSSVATTLNFSSLTTKQLEKFKPGTYSGKIIWNLNNTAASND